MRARAGRLPPAAVRVPPAAALLALLLGLWLLWRPPSPDLAGQVHRLDLFNAHGLALWDSGWYGGHYLLGYSLLFPPLAGLLGIHGLGVLAVLASTAIFARLARLAFGSRAPLATALFALGAAGDLYIGRLTFALGVTLALAAVLAAATAADPPATHTTTRARSRAASPPTTPAGSRARLGLTALLSLACAAASPVAALFLALAALADLLANRRPARALALGVPGLLLVLLLAALFPEGGTESFGVTSLLAAAGLSGVVLLLLPARERLLRTGIALYLVALALAYLIPSPVGSNAVRLGVLFAAPILVGCVRPREVERLLSGGRLPRPPKPRAARALFAVLLLGIIAWQVDGPIAQSVEASLDPSTSASYYAPALAFLEHEQALGGGPIRVEVPFTASHWESVYVARRLALTRGWDRQLDMRYDGLFYASRLSPGAYRAWLLDTATSFVALPDAGPDFSSVQEVALIRRGLPFLREVFHDSHWSIYAVIGARPLAEGPGHLRALGGDGFTLIAARPGAFTVRVRYTPWWRVVSGRGRVEEAPGGWTRVDVARAETVRVRALL